MEKVILAFGHFAGKKSNTLFLLYSFHKKNSNKKTETEHMEYSHI
jgi:hypothetical protein